MTHVPQLVKFLTFEYLKPEKGTSFGQSFLTLAPTHWHPPESEASRMPPKILYIFESIHNPSSWTLLKFVIADEHSTPQRLSFVDDPLGTQRLSFISADGSEIDSDYSSASSVIHVSDEQKNLE